MVQILALAASGAPSEWITPEQAASYVVKKLVAWELGDPVATLRGGINAKSGHQSLLELKPILCIRGPMNIARPHKSPPFSRDVLLRRDRCLCAYCGQVFKERDLTLDHVTPESRGGETDYKNLVAACRPCNNRKDNRTPEEARMPLLYVPYTPNLHEKFILANRTILADQYEFLMQSVPRHSRLWQ